MAEKEIDAAAVSKIAELGMKASEVTLIQIPTHGLGEGLPASVPVLFDRVNQRVIGLGPSLEAHRFLPERRCGTAKVETLAAFVALVNRHKGPDSAVFGQTSWPSPSLTAVIDYYTVDHKPDHGKHRVKYEFPITEEFKQWINGNGKPMEQADFAAFLEEHAAELASPMDAERSEFERLFKERFATPNELIELSRHLEINVNAKVKRAERLQTGERQVEFKEEHTDLKGQKVDIPGIFMISVPAFLDGDPVRIPARLRYRMGGGSIVWFYQLYRWEFWLRTRVQNDLIEVGSETELPTFEGNPEMGAS